MNIGLDLYLFSCIFTGRMVNRKKREERMVCLASNDVFQKLNTTNCFDIAFSSSHPIIENNIIFNKDISWYKT